ncbi:MAG: hypothetical protein QOE75_2256 [Solirubrobacterales bacterium]|jgi:hypothetical protein|nr:hypothetical protein [Solirubrobacterales bacterium]
MAYVVETKGGYEIRESRSTPKGPRSRTLATFKELSDEVIEKARARAAKAPEAAELREAAIRAGAPLAAEPVDRAARETLRLVAGGAAIEPMLRRLLLDALGGAERRSSDAGSPAAVSDAARAASQWIGVGLERRAAALVDLLGLADALPFEIRSEEIGFPRLSSV